jgi:hypothetical protein
MKGIVAHGLQLAHGASIANFSIVSVSPDNEYDYAKMAENGASWYSEAEDTICYKQNGKVVQFLTIEDFNNTISKYMECSDNLASLDDAEIARTNIGLAIGRHVQAYNENYVIDANYVHTDENFTNLEKHKLKGIANNANNYVHPTGKGQEHIPKYDTSNEFHVLKTNGENVYWEKPVMTWTQTDKPILATVGDTWDDGGEISTCVAEATDVDDPVFVSVS